MILDIYFEDKSYKVEVTEETLKTGKGFFDKMDRDMDAGWQMGPEFVEDPNAINRAQIAASRLLIALESRNEAMTRAMAGYILSRLPDVRAVHIDTSGQMLNTHFVMRDEVPR